MTDADHPSDGPDRRSKPESFRARSVTPALTVDDIHESVAWYRDVVGFVVEEEWEHDGELSGVSLIAGTITLLLTQDDFAKGRDREKGLGFSLHFSTAQDVDQRARVIRENGGTLAAEPEDTPWGTRAFRIRDPDGFMLTISSNG